ncbi:MAG: cytochrome c biogenesis protein CcsA [Flavobacteriales bacterium]|nr:cytochrome c biogenesis protein CcsA [Flavobacteriales bacterium]MBP6698709.1 cytochrome c biogenesis protein CcsA [Flavobacteriales bacterium]
MVLLLGVVLIGLRTPLSPALVHVSEDKLAPGPVEIEVLAYNTHFSSETAPQAWIENDGQRVCATSVTVLAENKLRLTFDVPKGLRNDLSHLVMHDQVDGWNSATLYDAFWTVSPGNGITETPCPPWKITVLNSMEPFRFPHRSLLNESVRNLFFHVPMWFAMMVLMTISVVHSVRYLRGYELAQDDGALSAAHVGLLFAVLGLVTGSIWARVTWGGWWTDDTKLNGAAVTTLIYCAYLVLRGSVPDERKAARLAAVYNIFAYVLMVVFLMVLPRLSDSLHPGNGGNPAFSQYDLDDRLRLVFYPAVLGWILLATWAYTLARRARRLQTLMHHAHDA